MTHGLPQYLRGLLHPRAFPHPVQSVELVETHISWILLTGEYAYKIKRPVRYPFVDLTSAEHRAYLCREELRLNRRFAPQLYLEVCPITLDHGEARIGGAGTIIEHAVKMRQFDRNEELDRLLADGKIEPGELDTFGRDLGVIHSGLPVAPQSLEWSQSARVRALMLANLDECANAARIFGAAADVQALREPLQQRLETAAATLTERLASGRVRECHGDLHSRNIVRREARLLAFDCLEFEPAFRWIDVADEIAFLLADLDSQQRLLHAHAFRSGYLGQTGDYQACLVLELHKAHRALVRAKVTALGTADAAQGGEPAHGGTCSTERSQFEAYLKCARRALSPKRPALVLMSGLAGSGKTWLATRIAPALDAVHLRSDVERKRLTGRPEQERSASGIEQGLYSREMTAGVYEHLLVSAGCVLEGGYTAIVDTSFRLREERVRFRDLALRLGVPVCVLHCSAPPEVLRARVTEREKRRDDASDADLEVLQWQQRNFEPVREDEQLAVINASTTESDVLCRSIDAIKLLQSTPLR